jgi:hypothetical protein
VHPHHVQTRAVVLTISDRCSRGDVGEFVGQDLDDGGAEAGPLEQLDEGRAGEVGHLAAGAAVADGEDDGAGLDVMRVHKDGVHRI